MRIGAHVDQTDPLAAADARNADVVQFFLGDPQGWKKPVLPDNAAEIKDSAVDVFIHAPYLVNVATSNNKIRVPSRKILAQQLEAAASIGAKALIVHGGHVLKNDDPELGFENWRKVFERLECPIPVYIENTAGGDNAMARRLDRIARLWETLGDLPGMDQRLGFCLDTCHAHSAGEELVDIVDRIKGITGRIDLVHCNNSRDPFDSGRDRHASLDGGTIDREVILAVVRAADAPVIVETPSDGQATDIAWLRENLDRP